MKHFPQRWPPRFGRHSTKTPSKIEGQIGAKRSKPMDAYPIPMPLWDALENVLTVKAKELIKDIAKTLNQPAQPLLEAFKANKASFYLQEMEDPTGNKFECEALLCQHAVAHRCRKPVLLGRKVCPEHITWKMPAVQNKPELKRINTGTAEVYFVDSLMNVYTGDFERVGMLVEGELVLFEVEEEEEYV